MSRFPNGGIPGHLLVEVGPYHWLTPGTAQRWAGLVADVLANEGVRLRITPGKNAYRDYEGQVFAKDNACAEGDCNDAADPGTSSHGGEYRGRDSMAIDVANWGELGQAKWYAYCRKHGFEPGFFDWEPWHIIDWAPYTMPSPSGGKAPKPETEEPIIEEDDMPIIIMNSDRKEWSLLDPDVGTDLPQVIYGQKAEFRPVKTASGVLNTYRGFLVTTDESIAAAWGRSYCRAYGNAPQVRKDVDYKIAQAESSRLSAEKHR